MPYKAEDKDEADALRAAMGVRIRLAREGRGWSQEHLAERVGVGAEMLGRYERGVRFPSHLTLVRLARVLGLTTDALLGIPDEARAGAEDLDLAAAVGALTRGEQRAVHGLVRELVAARYSRE
jgi:transcriptional regulator with XRE-family HTH domain